jgi:hypothetical protein
MPLAITKLYDYVSREGAREGTNGYYGIATMNHWDFSLIDHGHLLRPSHIARFSSTDYIFQYYEVCGSTLAFIEQI